MRTPMLLAVPSVALLLAACGDAAPRDEATADSVAPAAATLDIAAARKVALDTAAVQAITLTLEPGQALAPHESGARVVYALSDYTIRYTEGDSARSMTWRAGEVHAHPAGRHALENIGSTPASMLLIVRKDAVPLAAATVSEAEGTDPHTTGLLDDDRFRVGLVSLAPGDSLPTHAGLPRVVYALSDYTIAYASNGGAATEHTFVTGEAHWHDADRHAIRNTGTTEAKFLVVQLKR